MNNAHGRKITIILFVGLLIDLIIPTAHAFEIRNNTFSFIRQIVVTDSIAAQYTWGLLLWAVAFVLNKFSLIRIDELRSLLPTKVLPQVQTKLIDSMWHTEIEVLYPWEYDWSSYFTFWT